MSRAELDEIVDKMLVDFKFSYVSKMTAKRRIAKALDAYVAEFVRRGYVEEKSTNDSKKGELG